MIVATQTISYGENKINYQVVFNPRKRSRVSIHVLPDGTVRVEAPPETDLFLIKKAVLKRAQWVQNHIEQAHKQTEQVLCREYVSGESHFYLGRRHQLKIIENAASKPEVRLLRGRLHITTPDLEKEMIRRLLLIWYRDRAGQYFQRRLEAWVDALDWLSSPPQWRLRAMKKQWGSCSPKGLLTINPHLIKAPQRCIDYVLLHELCHLQEHNHGKKFYGLLDRHMPDWRSVKTELDNMSEMLLVT